MTPTKSKRTIAVASLVTIFLVLLFLTTLSAAPTLHHVPEMRATGSKTANDIKLQDPDLKGGSIMPKLGNETAKAELGRAAWKLFHTTMARFPDKPTNEESAALKTYIHLFQRLYPCGDCSRHFRKIIDKYPPQVTSRSAAAAWACHVHNEVNRSLKKKIWDCSNIGDFYDCGCAKDEADEKKEKEKEKEKQKGKENGKETESGKETEEGEDKSATPDNKAEMSTAQKEKITGDNGRELNEDLLPQIMKEGYGKGG